MRHPRGWQHTNNRT